MLVIIVGYKVYDIFFKIVQNRENVYSLTMEAWEVEDIVCKCEHMIMQEEIYLTCTSNMSENV